MTRIDDLPLPRPLVGERPPTSAPDAGTERALDLLHRAWDAVLEGAHSAEAALQAARFEIYRQASVSFGDPWRVARVADLEELSAEAALQAGDLEAAWRGWRTGWWIRQLLDDGAGGPRAVHSDRILQHLRRAREEAIADRA